MIALDTNVVARLIVQDDDTQLGIARKLLDQECFISWTVILELGWVLDAKYRMPRDKIVKAFQTIVALATVTIPHEDALHWALERFAEGADWADMMHLASCDSAIEAFASFDKRLARQAGAASPVAVLVVKA